MVERSVRVVLRANVADFKAQMRGASQSLDDLVKKSGQSAAAAQTRLGRMAQSAQLQREAWNTAGNAILGAGVLTALGVGLSLKQFSSFDEKMSHVQAATHETAANMGLLREAAVQAGADTAYSAAEAAGAIEELAKAGISTQDILNGGLSGALDLAAAGGLDVAKSAEIASMALTQFKLSGSDVGHVADLLSAGAGKAMGSVEDMGMALKQSGLVASQVGLNIEETSGALAAFASNGLLGSDAGTSFKTMLQRLNPQSKEARNLMDDLGLAFYNSRGEFVGIVDVARQLEEAFRGLSAEEIAANMQTLFGSDAVRAASVLYSEGAAGIQEWINKVNDSGYAAETAKIRMDNLAGDFEKLMGSVETVFLKSGSGVNNILRDIVQVVDGIVDAIGHIPPGVLSAVGVIGAFAAANMLARGAMLKFIPTIMDVRRAFKGLDTSVPFVGRMGDGLALMRRGFVETGAAAKAMSNTWVIARANGVSNIQAMGQAVTPVLGGMANSAKGFGKALLGAVGGPVGLAITVGLGAITYAISEYARKQAEAKQMAEEFRSVIEAAAGDLNAKSVHEAIAKKLQDSGAMGALKRYKIDMAVGIRAVTDDAAFAQVKSKLEGQIKQLDADLAEIQVAGKRYEIGPRRGHLMGDDAVRAGALKREINSIREVLDSYETLRETVGVQAAQQKEVADAVDAASQAHKENADAIGDAAAAADAQTEALKKLVEAQADLAGIVLSSRQAQRQFEESLDEAQEAINKSIESLGMEADWLDITTEAGRKNQAALDDIAKSAWDLVEARQAEGASESELQGIMENSRKNFLDMAQAMGMGEEQANDLANSLRLVPKDVRVNLQQQGADDVKRQAREVKDAVDGIPNYVPIHVNTSNVYSAIDGLRRLQEQINMTGGTTRVAMGQGGRGGHTFATGGAVFGPGTDTSDNIPALLSPGEHVLTASDVRKLGGHGNVYRLRAAIQAGNIPRFAHGGAVGTVPVPALGGGEVRVMMPDTVNLHDKDGTFLATMRAVASDATITTIKKAGVL